MISAAYLSTLAIISFIICTLILINFIIKIFGFKFYGSTTIPLVVVFVLCYLFALVPNLYPIAAIVDGKPVFGSNNVLVSMAVSIFDAIKMFAVSFKKDAILNYFNAGGYYELFSIGYVFTSVSALLFASISVIVFTMKTFGAKIKTRWFLMFSKRDICYIFSDPKVPIASTLAQDLLEKKKIVVMVITRSSQKTQEGTEYKDSLLMKGFDVRIENFSTGICRLIFSRFGRKRRTFVYGIFSNDDLSISLANAFQDTIEKSENRKTFRLYKINKKRDELTTSVESLNTRIITIEENLENTSIDKEQSAKLNKELLKAKAELEEKNKELLSSKKEMLTAYRNFKVFVTYHEADIDLNNNYSKKTKHIINTLSEYDIISTDFVLNNPIDSFIDIDKLDDISEGSMNVSFLGFGKINRPIFEKMTGAYQLWGDNTHKITYSILDRDSNKLAEFCNNEYTSKNTKDPEIPFLYKVQADCDQEDLTEFNTIEKYVERISKDKTRFTNTGFEHFIISVCDTNRDIKIATYLRKAIFKYISNNLTRCRIYVRISNNTLAQNFINNNDGVPIFPLTEYNDKFFYKKEANLPEVPIIVFGESALMSDYIANRYDKLYKLAIGTQKSYNKPTGNEELDYVNAELDIIGSNKKEFLQNTDAAYNMHIKTKLLGYELDYNFDIFDNSQKISNIDDNFFATIDNYKFQVENINSKDDIIKLAQLEHNRWVAASYILNKFSKWDKEFFIKFNQTLATNQIKDKKPKRDIADKGFKTSSNDAVHICMLTNSGLYNLKQHIDKQKFDNVTEDSIKNQSYKLVFTNDINQIKEMLKALNKRF